MKKIFEWLLILWISIPLMMEAMQVITNLDNYKIVVGWFTNVMYRKNTYYYIAAGVEICIVFCIFLEIKRKFMLWLGFAVIIGWQILKTILVEDGRAISYYYLKYNLSHVYYFLILSLYAALGIFLFYKSHYIKKGTV